VAVISAEATGERGSVLTVGAGQALSPWRAGYTGLEVTGGEVRAALATLSTKHRQVIMEIYYHHHSVAETADLLRIRASAVRSLAYSAIRELARALARTAAQPARGRCAGAPRIRAQLAERPGPWLADRRMISIRDRAANLARMWALRWRR
jgi:Sigma-70, region 4